MNTISIVTHTTAGRRVVEHYPAEIVEAVAAGQAKIQGTWYPLADTIQPRGHSEQLQELNQSLQVQVL